MQYDFIRGALAIPKAYEILPSITEYAGKYNGGIVFTRDIHDNGYSSSLESGKYPIHCEKYSRGMEIDESILRAVGGKKVKVYDKDIYGVAHLGERLKTDFGELDRVDIVGVCTGICVISNALILRTDCKDLPIYLHSDMCACESDESHNMALKLMEMNHIEIVR